MAYVVLGSASSASDTAKNVRMLTSLARTFRSTQVLAAWGSMCDILAAILVAHESGGAIDWGALGGNYLRDVSTAAKAIGVVMGIVGIALTPIGIGIPIDAIAAAFEGLGQVTGIAAGGGVPSAAQMAAVVGPMNQVSGGQADGLVAALDDPGVQTSIDFAGQAAAASGKLPPKPTVKKKAIPTTRFSSSSVPRKVQSAKTHPLVALGVGGLVIVALYMWWDRR